MRFVLVLTLAAMLLVQGCGKEGGEEATVITVWETYSAEERTIFLTWAEEFEQAHPGISVEVTNIPFDGMEPKVLTSLPT